jgi:vacuolar-type H+-ATPase subunit C/Vma6
LSPRIQSSQTQVLSERLRRFFETKDAGNLQTLLIEAGFMQRTGHNLNDLENLEVSIAEAFWSHYNQILYYLSDDLKDFFEACKILWDVENLKLLLCYVRNRKYLETSFRIRGYFGRLDSKSIESLGQYKTAKEIWENAVLFLPKEFSSEVSFEEERPINYLEFSLDLAAFKYLRGKSEEIGTQKVLLAWDSTAGIYEIENLITIARLKYFGTSLEDITPFIFPVQGKLNSSDIRLLTETEDYAAFLRALQHTPYGKCFSNGETNPMELEDSLKKNVRRLDFEKKTRDVVMEAIVNFFAEFEAQYSAIRKAAFFASIKGYDEG